MPLRKLWNSIRGKSATPTVSSTPETGDGPRAASPTSAEPHPRSAGTPASPTATPVAAADPPRTSRNTTGTATRDDKKLFRRIESLSVQSVLEVCVGDGQRSLAMLHSLTHKGHSTPIHYIAIDEFEMGGNALSLRNFHKQLREFPAKAHLVPMTIDAGLDRVVRTYGQVDLVLWSAAQPPTPAQQNALTRLCKPTTIVFAQENGRWSETLTGLTLSKRAA
ncbi:hypothetical protein Mal15_07860 [Stieleria maiorica]|uniref:Uncharacterized protein n=1 Tax=Stieleria maiorica TaxID=2795974 RepID=A0A5B9M983_9BACT|nr:hypothetical protein [Stieleria maiorica]QEF96756.1 hypothetical protein Mal15_07860 [Stieleria maiorica]